MQESSLLELLTGNFLGLQKKGGWFEKMLTFNWNDTK